MEQHPPDGPSGRWRPWRTRAHFEDRAAAGRLLAGALTHLVDAHPVVVGIPRGGVIVAEPVAAALGAPLDMLMVRKLGTPGNPELAIGAIGEDGVRIVDGSMVARLHVTDAELAAVESAERVELNRRSQHYRSGVPAVLLQGRVVVVVDDGLATGASARAACEIARLRGAARVILAVPVAPAGWVDDLRAAADEYVAVLTPSNLHAVGEHYADFSATSDQEVIVSLQRGARPSRD